MKIEFRATKDLSVHVIQSFHFIGGNEAWSDDENCSALHSQEAAEIRVESLQSRFSVFPY